MKTYYEIYVLNSAGAIIKRHAPYSRSMPSYLPSGQ
jgi:hypothetical protein